MIVTYFRSSSYNTDEDCRHRFFLEYVLGWTGPANISAVKGTVVHKVLEILAAVKLAEQNGEKKIYDAEVLKERKISSLSNIDKLTDEIFEYYKHNNQHIQWKVGDKTDCKSWVKKTLTANAGMFDPRHRDIVSPEQQFDITIDEEWAKYSYDFKGQRLEGNLALKGTIDLITRIDDNLYEVIDWKTGRRWDWNKGVEKTNEKLNKDPQLMLYHYAVHKLYPQIEDCLITINFINDGGPFTITFTNKDLIKTEEMLKRKFEAIKATRIPKLNKSWKCSKLCHQGKTTFEDTHITSQIEDREGQTLPLGYVRTKCEQTHFMIKQKGIDWVTENYMKPGFTPGHYQAPGAV